MSTVLLVDDQTSNRELVRDILGAMLGFEALLAEGIEDLVERGVLGAADGRTLLADLAQIRKGGRRAAELTQQLLTFGSRKHISVSALDLNEAVRESHELLAPTAGDRIQITAHLAPDLRPVLAEPVNIGRPTLWPRSSWPAGTPNRSTCC